jgi:hypothetical protein
LNQLPGAENPVASNNPREAIGKLYDMNFDYQGCELKIEKIQEHIERTFFNDLFFTIISRPEMTATEVVQRHEEQLIMLGPVIERQITELLDPVIERTFNIMNRNGMIPPPPLELAGQGLKIDYISLLAQAQKMMGLQHMDMYLNMTSMVAGIPPDHPVFIKNDYDAFQDEYAMRLGIPPEVTRSPEMVAAIQQQQAAERQRQERMEAMANMPEDIKKLSQAKTDDDNVLTDVVDMVTE